MFRAGATMANGNGQCGYFDTLEAAKAHIADLLTGNTLPSYLWIDDGNINDLKVYYKVYLDDTYKR